MKGEFDRGYEEQQGCLELLCCSVTAASIPKVQSNHMSTDGVLYQGFSLHPPSCGPVGLLYRQHVNMSKPGSQNTLVR